MEAFTGDRFVRPVNMAAAELRGAVAPNIFGPPTLVGIGTLEFTLVRPCVRASVRKILNDYPLYFSEILHGVTTLYGGET